MLRAAVPHCLYADAADGVTHAAAALASRVALPNDAKRGRACPKPRHVSRLHDCSPVVSFQISF